MNWDFMRQLTAIGLIQKAVPQLSRAKILHARKLLRDGMRPKSVRVKVGIHEYQLNIIRFFMLYEKRIYPENLSPGWGYVNFKPDDVTYALERFNTRLQ